MSGFLSALANSGDLPAFIQKLRPASFRGVPFEVEGHEENSGRRGEQHEFPGWDIPIAEDLGRKGGVYRIRAFVVGDDYMPNRDALRQAVQWDGTTGVLVHPYLGNLMVKPGLMRMEEQVDPAGIALFDLIFLEDGQQSWDNGSGDTASSLLAGISSTLAVIKTVYGYGTLIAEDPAALGALAGVALGAFGASVLTSLGLPASMLSLLGPLATSLSSSPDDQAATAASVTNLTQTCGALAVAQCQASTPSQAQALAAAAVASIAAQATATATIDGLPASLASTPTPSAAAIAAAIANAQTVTTTATDDPVAGIPLEAAVPTDPSFGLIILAQWTPPAIEISVSSGAVPATVLLPQLQGYAAAVQASIQALVQGASLCAVAQLYAQIDWPDAQAATAAGDELLDLIDAQIETASDAAQDDLAMAWRGMWMLVANDTRQRAQSLPQITTYQRGAALPACLLAQQLYRDGTRAGQLAQLNSAWHAGWLPVAGLALAA